MQKGGQKYGLLNADNKLSIRLYLHVTQKLYEG